MKTWQWIGTGVGAFAVAVSLINASWIAPRRSGPLILVAHRGVAQQYDHQGIDDRTCTAERMLPSEHDFIDNTLRSFSNARSNRVRYSPAGISTHPNRWRCGVVACVSSSS